MVDFIIFGLGNPGANYAKSRHSAGRLVVDFWAKEKNFSDWVLNKKRQSLESKGTVGHGLKKKEILLVKPETFMNKSGQAVGSYVNGCAAGKKILVIYDDIDLPLGVVRFSFGRSAGGHRGLDSIIKTLKTKDFARLRLGVSPRTPTGKIKKPSADKVMNFVINDFKSVEEKILKKVLSQAVEAGLSWVENGLEKAMNFYN
ncbi:MAG: aminoacyl-tRNA hydrolase [Candidatus Paceibacterota bacterium]|jgi:PTH1 family peptidyl-tRNA hydrolase